MRVNIMTAREECRHRCQGVMSSRAGVRGDVVTCEHGRMMVCYDDEGWRTKWRPAGWRERRRARRLSDDQEG